MPTLLNPENFAYALHGYLGFKCTLAGKYLYAQINARKISVMCVFHFNLCDYAKLVNTTRTVPNMNLRRKRLTNDEKDE